MAEQIASRDWHTRAIVRVVELTKTATPEGGKRDFYVGEEVEMIQWGREGRPVDRSRWWTSFDIDGAHIIKASKVEVVRVLEEVLPEGDERLDGFNDLPLDGDDDSGWDTPPPGPILG